MLEVKVFGGAPSLKANLTFRNSTAVVGLSGSGKTTLLRSIVGLHPASVHLNGKDVSDLMGVDRGISIAWQDTRLLPNMTVSDNIKLSGKVNSYMISLLELGPLLGRMPASLSGGEQQRVNLARATGGSSRVVLLDEPSQGLDPYLSQKVLGPMVRHLQDSGRLVILVTHDLPSLFGIVEDVVHVHKCKVGHVYPLRRMYDEPVSSRMAEFFGKFHVLSRRDLASLGHDAQSCMVRPEWLSLRAGAESPNAKVTSVRWNGSANCVTVVLDTDTLLEIYTNTNCKEGDHVKVFIDRYSNPNWIFE